MFYTDGRHSNVYMHEPPMHKQQLVEPINEILDLGIDTITYREEQKFWPKSSSLLTRKIEF